MRITVKNKRGRQVAQAEATVYDPRNDAEVIAAAKAVVNAARGTWPSPAKVVVERDAGRGRWRTVRELVA